MAETLDHLEKPKRYILAFQDFDWLIFNSDTLHTSVFPCLGQSCVQPHSWLWGWCWAGCRDKTLPAAETGRRCRSAGLWSGGAAQLWSWTDASLLLSQPRSGPPAGNDGSHTPLPGPHTHPVGWKDKHPKHYSTECIQTSNVCLPLRFWVYLKCIYRKQNSKWKWSVLSNKSILQNIKLNQLAWKGSNGIHFAVKQMIGCDNQKGSIYTVLLVFF